MIVVLLGEDTLCNSVSSYLQQRYSEIKVDINEETRKLERPMSFKPFKILTSETTVNLIYRSLLHIDGSKVNDDDKIVGTADTAKSFKEKIRNIIPQLISPFLSVLKSCGKKDNSIILGFKEEEVERWESNPNIIIFRVINGGIEEKEKLINQVLLWENNSN